MKELLEKIEIDHNKSIRKFEIYITSPLLSEIKGLSLSSKKSPCDILKI